MTAPIMMFEEFFLFGILPEVDTVRYYTDLIYRQQKHHAANEIMEREIERRPYSEDQMVYMKGALEVRLGAERKLTEGAAAWLHPAVDSTDTLRSWMRRVEKDDIGRKPVLETWRQDKERFEKESKGQITFKPSMTGPVTLAGNLLGQTNLCLWAMLEPELMDDFFDLLGRKQIDFYEALALEEDGDVRRDGLGINDDSCCLFSPDLYERLCVPYLSRLFDTFAPQPGQRRRQHSDSAMAHLMPILQELGVNEVNFGPSIHPATIRDAMPEAMIHGQMPPLTLRNGSREDIQAIVQRDANALGHHGDGWIEGPAGVVAAGTPFVNLRTYMDATLRIRNGE